MSKSSDRSFRQLTYKLSGLSRYIKLMLWWAFCNCFKDTTIITLWLIVDVSSAPGNLAARCSVEVICFFRLFSWAAFKMTSRLPFSLGPVCIATRGPIDSHPPLPRQPQASQCSNLLLLAWGTLIFRTGKRLPSAAHGHYWNWTEKCFLPWGILGLKREV